MPHSWLVSKVTSCSLEDGCTAILRITGCLPIVPCISPDPRQPRVISFLLMWGWWCRWILLVNKQNGNKGFWWIYTSKFPNMYKFTSALKSFSLCVWCVCVCVGWSLVFLNERPWKSTWSSSKIQTSNHQNEEPHMSLPIYYERWKRTICEPSPVHSPTSGHMHLDCQGFWYLPVQLHRWIGDGKWC